MASVCFYLQAHQPFRLRRYSVFDTDHYYFDDLRNAEFCRRVTHRCYLPAGRALLDLVRQHEGRFKLAMSFTGVLLDQLEAFAPEVLELFKQLVATGHVEVLAETYHHSLASLFSREEFAAQVGLHRARIEGLFGVTPKVFRNSELIYSDAIGSMAGQMGFEGVLAEGADQTLHGAPGEDASAGRLYRSMGGAGGDGPKLLLRNGRLSDDIAFRFSDRNWSQHPLLAGTFARWIEGAGLAGDRAVNLFMDLETFGDHQWAETGILDFLRHLPGEILALKGHDFATPSELIRRLAPAGMLSVPTPTSWADVEHDASAWLGNAMQTSAMAELYKLEKPVKATKEADLLADWRRLTTSNHCYYMSTKFWTDPAARNAFNPYESPYDAYINFMNVLDNIANRAGATGKK